MRDSKEVIRIIRKLREDKKMSVEELAKRVGIAKSTQSRYENEQRDFPINDIGSYANALGTSIEYLLDIGEASNSGSVNGLSIHEEGILRKYNALDDIGKYTVDTTLEAQYERCTKPHLTVVAAHNDDYSEEQQKLMREDLEMIEQLHKKHLNKKLNK